MESNKRDSRSLRNRIINSLIGEKVVIPERKSPRSYADINILDVRGSFDLFR